MKAAVVYFSASGKTRHVAAELASHLEADLFEIVPEEAYTDADLDWRNKKSRSSLEMTDASSRPAITGPRADFSGYDTVCIGFPIWWGVAPRPVDTFLDSVDLAGKDVFIFATSGGSGISYASEDIRKRYPFLRLKGAELLSAGNCGHFAKEIMG